MVECIINRGEGFTWSMIWKVQRQKNYRPTPNNIGWWGAIANQSCQKSSRPAVSLCVSGGYTPIFGSCACSSHLFSSTNTPAGLHLLVASLGLAIFTAVYVWIMWPHPLNKRARARFGLRTSSILTVSLTLFVLFLTLMYGSSFLWLFIGVSAIAGITLPFRSAAIAVFSLTLLSLGASLAISGGIASANWLLILPFCCLSVVLAWI